MTKHTKGPWTVQKNEKSLVYRVLKPNLKQGLAICGTLEDAQLIASAPDLLQIVQTLADQFDFGEQASDYVDEDIFHLIQASKKALAKVRGNP